MGKLSKFLSKQEKKLIPTTISLSSLKESDILMAVNCVNPLRFIDRVDDRKLNYNDALVKGLFADYQSFYQETLEISDDSKNWSSHS